MLVNVRCELRRRRLHILAMKTAMKAINAVGADALGSSRSIKKKAAARRAAS